MNKREKIILEKLYTEAHIRRGDLNKYMIGQEK